jgi:hypothetical protein
MPRPKNNPLVLAQLRRGTLFKVAEPLPADTNLTLEGVYEIDTAKADHGRSVRVRDLAGMRQSGMGFSHSRFITVSSALAKETRVYKLRGST